MAQQIPQDIQDAQTNYRRTLVQNWHLPVGAKLLEVGCGQGDMTAVLADAVGPDGHVTAVDIAPESYGAPQTLGQALSALQESVLGDRIKFQLEFDVLAPTVSFPPDAFDGAVLVHSSWYFQSPDHLGRTLSRLRDWAKTLYFVEWDIEPRLYAQTSHMMAAMIQGQVEAFKGQSEANIRTPLSAETLRRSMESQGWKVVRTDRVETLGLQDADWEISHTLGPVREEIPSLAIPERAKSHLQEQLEVLGKLALKSGNQTLDAFSVIATRQ